MLLKAWKLLNSQVTFGGNKKSGEMPLAERMEKRHDMVRQSVREYLLALDVLSGMYRFSVMAVDERAHRFDVLIEIGKGFSPRKAGISMALSQVESHLQVCARERYGVIIRGVFWKVNEEVERFEGSVRGSLDDQPRIAAAGRARPVRGYASEISDSEIGRLQAAVRRNKPVTAIKVAGRV